MEETMTKATCFSPITSTCRPSLQGKLATLGIVAKQFIKDDLLGQGLLLRAMGF